MVKQPNFKNIITINYSDTRTDNIVNWYNRCLLPEARTDELLLGLTQFGKLGKKSQINRGTYTTYHIELIDDIDNNSDIYMDEIVNIELIKPTHTYVYDLTVENDLTFVLGSQIIVHDTFHHAGIGALGATTLGVARIKELLSLSKNIKTPVMYLYLEEKYKKNSEIANKIASYLRYTTLADIETRINIYYDPNPEQEGGFMEKDNVSSIFYSPTASKTGCQPTIEGLPLLLRIELDKEKMFEKDITLLDIKSNFCNNWEKRYIEPKGLGKEEKALLERITQVAILSNSDNDSIPIIHIRFDMNEIDFTQLIHFVEIFVDNFKLKGLENIEKIIDIVEENVISFENENEELRMEKQNTIYIAGVNMLDIRYINGIDLYNTITNDIVIIHDIFGIDATRMILLKEFRAVFKRSFINYQHLELLIDIMTHNGTLMSIDRHGMNRSDIDPLTRASFEKTVEQLISASVFNEIDYMRSVSSRISAGLVIQGGTGLCNIILDAELLEKSEYTEDMQQQYVKTYTDLTVSSVLEDIPKQNLTGLFVPT